MNDALFQHNILGNKVTLYNNRLEVETPGMFGKKDTILLRNITDVEIGFGKNMAIHTSDGKKRMVPVSGNAAKELKGKIMELL